MKALEKGVPTVEQWLAEALPKARFAMEMQIASGWWRVYGGAD